jgi:hypothetical protein
MQATTRQLHAPVTGTEVDMRIVGGLDVAQWLAAVGAPQRQFASFGRCEGGRAHVPNVPCVGTVATPLAHGRNTASNTNDSGLDREALGEERHGDYPDCALPSH